MQTNARTTASVLKNFLVETDGDITIRCTRSRGPRGFWEQWSSPRPGERCRYPARLGIHMRTYEIPCDCGKLLRFSSAKAGSTFICDCGTKINVPSLGEFKEAVQQDTTAPSLTLRDLAAFSVAGIVLIFVFRSWYVEWIMDPRVDSLFFAIGMTLVIVGYFWLKTLVSSEMGRTLQS